MQEQTEVLMALATEQGFAFLVAFGTMLRGWTLAAQGYAAEGMAQLREGLAAHQAMGAELYRPYFLVRLAEACRQGGQVEEGLRVLHEAVAVADKHGQRWWAAERHRLKGELLWQEGTGQKESEAEACFQHALDVARRAAGKIPRTPRRHEPGAPVAAPGQARRSPRAAGGDLWLVHRGL